MFSMPFFSRKHLSFLLIIAISAGLFFPFLYPVRKAQAQFAVIIAGSSPAQMLQEQATQVAAQTVIKKVVEKVLAILLETLRKRLLDSFVDSIVKWIQGADDKPAFITNWSKFLGGVVNEAVGDYIKTTQAAFICQPFQAQVILNLPQPGRPPLPTCTLNQIVDNIENFYEDFRSGGWVAYNEMLYPWNNPYGSYLMALEGEAYEVAKAVSDKSDETQQSQGFLNTKRCKAGKEVYDIQTQEKKCLEWETTTPGGLIAGQVQQVLQVDINYILSSQEFEVYAAAILDALTNRLFRAGVNGLLGILTPNAQEDLGNESPEGLNFKCDTTEGICTLDPAGTFTDKATCEADCKKKEPAVPTCDNCSGIFVRGRYSYPYNLNPNDKNCSGDVCGKCSSVPANAGPCAAFCQNLVSSELWPENELGSPHTFGSDVINQYQALFTKFGYTTPSTCTCNLAILGDWASYGISAGGGACRGCIDLPIGHACSSVDWCDTWCSGGGFPTPTPIPTITPMPTPIPTIHPTNTPPLP
jgi:hypothetical protein